MKNIKSKLITSIAILVGCVTLLVGTSFAWFTKQVKGEPVSIRRRIRLYRVVKNVK